MAHKLTRKSNHTVEIDAQLEAAVVDRERQTIIAKVRRRAHVPGFRPGKAPLGAVKARYGDEIRSELEEHLSLLVWQELADSGEELQPLTRPQVSTLDLADDGAFRFIASMEVRPTYELPDLDGVSLPEHSLEVQPAEVDAELGRIQQEQAAWEPADEQTAVDGMLVEADLHGEIDDGDEPYDEEDARFVIGSEGVPAPINEALQGAKVGDERTASKRFPDDDKDPKRAGKTVRYTIRVKALKQQVLPPVDDELATTIGLESLAQLRERIESVLRQRKLAERRDAWRRHLLDHLEAQIDVNDLPPSLVQSSLSEDLHRFAYTMAMQGMSPESQDFDWQEMATRFEPGARRKVLDTLVLETLADSWQIEVPESAVDQHIAVEAQRAGVPPGEHKANMAKEGQLAQLRHAALLAATVDELIKRAGGEVD